MCTGTLIALFNDNIIDHDKCYKHKVIQLCKRYTRLEP